MSKTLSTYFQIKTNTDSLFSFRLTVEELAVLSRSGGSLTSYAQTVVDEAHNTPLDLKYRNRLLVCEVIELFTDIVKE